jgi:hypothetical protein
MNIFKRQVTSKETDSGLFLFAAVVGAAMCVFVPVGRWGTGALAVANLIHFWRLRREVAKEKASHDVSVSGNDVA